MSLGWWILAGCASPRPADMDAYFARHCPGAATPMVPSVVVLHGTPDTVDEAKARFAPPELPAGHRLRRGGSVNVGAHFVVDRDGTVARLAPEDRPVRHCIGLNHRALAIESVGDGPGHPLTQAQVRASAALVRELAGRWPLTHLVGHHEANGLADTELWCEADPDYWGLPLDPGPDFVAAVRLAVVDLGLEGVDGPAPPP